MNGLSYLLIVMLTLSACDDTETDPGTLHGKWLMVEQNVGTGPAGVWLPAENPITLELLADSTFTTSARPGCKGTYSVKGDLLNFNLDCAGTSIISGDRFVLDTYLILSPAIPVCDEGCAYKYMRL